MTKLAKECAQKSWLQVRNYALKGKGYVPFPSASPFLQQDVPRKQTQWAAIWDQEEEGNT